MNSFFSYLLSIFYLPLCNYYNKRKYHKHTNYLIKKNKLSKPSKDRIMEFKKNWERLSKNIDPIEYAFFSNYVDDNKNIITGQINSIIEPILNPIEYQRFYEDKNIYGILHRNFKRPKTYLRGISGSLYDENYKNVKFSNQTDFDTYFSNISSFVIKPAVDSGAGTGVLLCLKKEDAFYDQRGSVLDFNRFLKNYSKNCIVEAVIEQSDFMSQFNPASINTLRLVAYRSVVDNEVHITNAIIRIGQKGSVIDNACAGGVFCGINNSGKLNPYLMNKVGEKFTNFNGINFETNEFVVPNYDEIKTFATSIAKDIIHHRLIAFDIAIDCNNSPLLVEYNIGAFSYWLFQYVGQITLDGYTDEIIKYCIDRNVYKRILSLK